LLEEVSALAVSVLAPEIAFADILSKKDRLATLSLHYRGYISSSGGTRSKAL